MYRFTFDDKEFTNLGSGRIELWEDDTHRGTAKWCSAVGMAVTDPIVPLDESSPVKYPAKWLLKIDEKEGEAAALRNKLPEEMAASYLSALYETAFQSAQKLGAAGVASELIASGQDDPALEEVWTTLAHKYNATFEKRPVPIGGVLDSRISALVYVDLFQE